MRPVSKRPSPKPRFASRERYEREFTRLLTAAESDLTLNDYQDLIVALETMIRDARPGDDPDAPTGDNE